MRCFTHIHTESLCEGQDTHSQAGSKKGCAGGCGQLMGKALAPFAQSGDTFGWVAGRESVLVEPDQPFLLL